MAHPPAGHTAAGRRDTTDEESLRALVEQRRAEAERAEHSGERPIDAILAAALDRFADRTTTEAQITSWADTIVRIVADAGFHRSIAQRAASAIVCHGLDADVVREILSAVQRKRRERTLEGAGKYFHFRIRSECSKAGVPWPKPKGSHEV